MPDTTAEVAVVGLGAMGAFACLELARGGVDVVGIDRFDPPHDRGSHSGDTRVFRQACGEGLSYGPLAERAGKLWDEWGEAAGAALLHRKGLLRLGPADHPVLAATRAAAAASRTPLEEFTADELAARYPMFVAPAGSKGIFEPTAGWVDANRAIAFALATSRAFGAELRTNTPLNEWRREGSRFVLETLRGRIRSRRLILAAGAWSHPLAQALGLPLTIVRKSLIWIHPKQSEEFEPDRLPVFAWAGGSIYGFPDFEGGGVKIGLHENAAAPIVRDPSAADPEPDDREALQALAAAAALMPRLVEPPPLGLDRVVQTKTCFYTLTPDRNFIVDLDPRHPRLVYAAGFSGHGFKFAPAIGRALAESVMANAISPQVAFLQRGTRF